VRRPGPHPRRAPGGGDLLFCGHHGRLHADALAKVALTVDGDKRP
jgi:hypothetical protein